MVTGVVPAYESSKYTVAPDGLELIWKYPVPPPIPSAAVFATSRDTAISRHTERIVGNFKRKHLFGFILPSI